MRTRKDWGSHGGGDEDLSFSGVRRHVDLNIGIDVSEKLAPQYSGFEQSIEWKDNIQMWTASYPKKIWGCKSIHILRNLKTILMYMVRKVSRFSFSGAHTVFCQIFCSSPFVITVLFLMRRIYLSIWNVNEQRKFLLKCTLLLYWTSSIQSSAKCQNLTLFCKHSFTKMENEPVRLLCIVLP
jgi:hypothetical protein